MSTHFEFAENDFAPKRKPRVLVADDDNVIRTFVRAILSADYEIVEAADGAEAIRILDGSNDIMCVLADDRMPNATGFDVSTHVRDTARLRSIPVAIMTAKETSTALRQVQSRQAGAVAFLNKPFTRPQILRLVEALVRQREIRKTA